MTYFPKKSLFCFEESLTSSSPFPTLQIFSKKQLSEDTLASLFTTITTTYHKEWKAYPLLPPSPPESSFVLHTREFENEEERGCKIGGVYYTNAMESLVSAMETQAIAAYNVVQLLSSSCSSSLASSCEIPQ